MSKKIFEVRTLKSVIIKILFECIKPYIKETNILFTPDGIKISTFDSTKCSITYIKLNADKFEYFFCEKPTIIGVDITALYKLIKSVNIRETITFFLDESSNNKLGVILEDSFKGKVKRFSLPLLEIEEPILTIPELEFDYIINVPSGDFQQIVRDFDLLESKIIDIKSIGNQLIFSSDDGIAEFQTTISEIENTEQKALLQQNGEDIKTLTFLRSTNDIVQGKFKLYFLMYFIKATHLCQNINIYLKNDHPLVLEYFVADLGALRFLLSPQM